MARGRARGRAAATARARGTVIARLGLRLGLNVGLLGRRTGAEGYDQGQGRRIGLAPELGCGARTRGREGG